MIFGPIGGVRTTNRRSAGANTGAPADGAQRARREGAKPSTDSPTGGQKRVQGPKTARNGPGTETRREPYHSTERYRGARRSAPTGPQRADTEERRKAGTPEENHRWPRGEPAPGGQTQPPGAESAHNGGAPTLPIPGLGEKQARTTEEKQARTTEENQRWPSRAEEKEKPHEGTALRAGGTHLIRKCLKKTRALR